MERIVQTSRYKKLFRKFVASDTKFLAIESHDIFSIMIIGDHVEENTVSLSAIENTILDSSANMNVVRV